MKAGQMEAKLAKIQKLIEAEEEKLKVFKVATILALMADYGLSRADLPDVKAAPTKKAAVKKAKTPKPIKGNGKGTRPPKYRNPETGNTWSGFGHAPEWIAGAKNRDEFLIPA
jgi:DNA-binding protein H-NS